MVGIVLVSHSYALAEGAKELSRTMAGAELKIAAAGGLDDDSAVDKHTLGTDPMKILAAIQEVYSEDGVLIFVDMGSALLSSDLALQFLSEEEQKHVFISDAPFIEGAVTAAVQARMNTPLPQILKELKQALLPKQAQLGREENPDAREDSAEQAQNGAEADRADRAKPEKTEAEQGEDNSLKLCLKIKNALGIHARPAAKIVTLAGSFSDLTLHVRRISDDKAPVNCRSLNSLTLLGLRQNEAIEFVLSGADAAAGLEALRALAAAGFGDGVSEAAVELNGKVAAVAGKDEGEEATEEAGGLARNMAEKATREEPGVSLLECQQNHDSEVFSPQRQDIMTSLSSSLSGIDPQVSGCALEELNINKELHGLCVSAGLAAGPAFFLKKKDFLVSEGCLPHAEGHRKSEAGVVSMHQGDETRASEKVDPGQEWQHFQRALSLAKEQLKEEKTKIKKTSGPEAAAIFDAHLLILDDPLLQENVRGKIEQEAKTAAVAWDVQMRELEASYSQNESAIIRERTADIRDLRSRLLQFLLRDLPDESPSKTSCPEQMTEKNQQAEGPVGGGILLAELLGPGEVAALDKNFVRGICTVEGSASSHAAVIARSLGIPALMGMGPELLRIPEGCPLLMDAEAGVLYLSADDEIVQRLEQKKAAEDLERQEAERLRELPAITQSGRRIEIFANIGSAEDARRAVEKGAEGVGLLRTEFIYLRRSSAPDEEEQLAIYTEIARALDGRPLTVRTLDAGGDKPLPYLQLPEESNPFLGYRAIRICLKETELFRTQLRAILRTAATYPLRLMFPMIASLAELRAAKEQLVLAGEELKERGLPLPEKLSVGMMIEIPSAALMAEDFAREVDFFSIGTNDLTQYTLAAERGNQEVSGVYTPRHPAVLKLIRKTVESAHKVGISVAVCGEFAADPEGSQILVDMGVDELSVNPIAIPGVKQNVRRLHS